MIKVQDTNYIASDHTQEALGSTRKEKARSASLIPSTTGSNIGTPQEAVMTKITMLYLYFLDKPARACQGGRAENHRRTLY